MKKIVFLSLITFQLLSCGSETVPKENSEITIPKEGFSFQLAQRSSIQIPSKSVKIEASINDITGAQTLITMKADSTTFFSSAIHQGDTLNFSYKHSAYKITCIDLVNNLIGEDIGSFKIFQ